MKNKNLFSCVTKQYLTSFYCILEDMIEGMTCAELSNSISSNFIVQMIPHHMAAIEMSQNILKYTTDISVQTIASGIITEQTKSIENMRKIAKACAEITNTEQDLALYNRHTELIMSVMFSDMKNSRAGNNINCDFMWEMVPHHKGAVEMSNNALHFDICPELVPILDTIIASQKRGIAQMCRLLKCNC
ncbi:hypothetical protein IMSAG049_01279 [Clostridiales bacterium]|nr:hypothetical protein IMSAG049_01279 [Clostridiales bacterium]